MSGMDPFGSSGGPYGSNRRGKSAPGGGVASDFLGQLSHAALDVKSHLGGRGKGWSTIGSCLGAVDVLYGIVMLLWGLIWMRGHVSQFFALFVALAMTMLGGSGLAATVRKDAASIKSLNLTAAAVVALLASAFVYQMGHGTRTDCVLAETFLRLDHLEDAIHAVKHEELINGMMMRMDHLATQIEHVQDHAGEKVEEAQKRADYKDSDMRYVDAKLNSLLSLTDRAMMGIDDKVAEISRNVTALEEPGADVAQGMTVPQLKARIRSLQYRQRTLTPRKDALRELLVKLDGYRNSGEVITVDEYDSIIRTLEANTAALAEDLRADVLAERSDALAVKGSAARLANDEYNRIKVGDYHIREEERTKKQQDDRSKYETYMANINKARTKTLTDRHSYLRSLNRFLENMPEHCMEDLDTVLPGQIFGSIAVLLSVASGYIALTSTVLSMKKDY